MLAPAATAAALATIRATKPMRKKISKAVTKKLKIPDPVRTFAAALHDPFSDEAKAARVMDLYAAPTETRMIKTTLVLRSDSNGSGCILMLPNPYLTVIDLGGVGSILSINQPGGMRAFTPNTFIYGLTSPALLSPEAESFRVVSFGARVSNPQPEATGVGRIYTANVPVGLNGLPSWNELENTTMVYASDLPNLFARAGFPTPSTCASAAIQSLPQATFNTIGDFIEANMGLEMTFGITNPSFYEFKTAAADVNSFTSTRSAGDEIVWTTATGAVVAGSSGFKAPTQSNGACAQILYYEGFPAGITSALLVELVCHLEVSPTLRPQVTSSGGGIVPIPDSVAEECVGSSMAVEAALAAQHRFPKTRSVHAHGTTGAEFMNRKGGRSSGRPAAKTSGELISAMAKYLM